MNREKLLGGNKGFTLIEMAIVLIIIGIIIGAVVKGKDIIKSAEQKKLYTKYVSSWQLAYNNYYDRTGWILGDDASDTNATRDGQCSNASVGNLEAQLKAIGLTPPSEGPTGSSLVRTYTDSQGVQHALILGFKYNVNIGNYIDITDATNGIPFDLGIAWDRLIDDIRDGTAGDFRYAAASTAPQTNIAWPGADTSAVPASAAILRLEF